MSATLLSYPVAPVDQEYYSMDQLVTKLGLSESRARTLREKTYRGLVPGQVRIMGRWYYRIVDIDKALLNGGF